SASPKVVQEMGSSTVSRPSSVSSGWRSSSSSAGRNSTAASFFGSISRSCPPWVKVRISAVPGATSSLAAARSRRLCSPSDMTSRWVPSTPNSRSIPRRVTPLNFAPSSAAMSPFLVGCLATPATGTSTDLTLRSPTSRSRSLRRISSSGSSGMWFSLRRTRRGAAAGAGQLRRLVAGGFGRLLLEALVGVAGRGLLRLLLGAAAPLTPRPAGELDAGPELLLVLGALVAQHVPGQLAEAAGGELLEAGLVVAREAAVEHLLDPVLEQVEHQRRRRAEPAVEVHRADHGLHAVGEDRGLLPPSGRLLAPAARRRGPEAAGPRHRGERGGAHELGAVPGEDAFARLGCGPVQVVGHHQAEHRVAEELEPLVGGNGAVLGAPGAVPEGELQELRVGEPVGQQVTEVVAGVDGGDLRVSRRRSRRHPAPTSGPRDPRPRSGSPPGARRTPARSPRRARSTPATPGAGPR